MASIDLDLGRLLGFRLLDEKETYDLRSGAKIGLKDGVKLGEKLGTKTGRKVGTGHVGA